jgi:hypothetical protein
MEEKDIRECNTALTKAEHSVVRFVYVELPRSKYLVHFYGPEVKKTFQTLFLEQRFKGFLKAVAGSVGRASGRWTFTIEVGKLAPIKEQDLKRGLVWLKREYRLTYGIPLIDDARGRTSQGASPAVPAPRVRPQLEARGEPQVAPADERPDPLPQYQTMRTAWQTLMASVAKQYGDSVGRLESLRRELTQHGDPELAMIAETGLNDFSGTTYVTLLRMMMEVDGANTADRPGALRAVDAELKAIVNKLDRDPRVEAIDDNPFISVGFGDLIKSLRTMRTFIATLGV